MVKAKTRSARQFEQQKFHGMACRRGYRSGTPVTNETLPALAVAAEARFWSRVDKGTDCWTWTGTTTPQGYGMLRLGGGRGRPIGVHRVSFIIANGSIPEGLDILHRCDNPPCVRPDHLYAGTHSRNMQDTYDRGRHRSMADTIRGERNVNARLTDSDVIAIRAARSTGAKLAELGRVYGVDQSTIWKVVNHKAWTHIA